ncbi:MAG: hypothetical protein AB7V11_01155 [Pyrinomonadaceae bacterium]
MNQYSLCIFEQISWFKVASSEPGLNFTCSLLEQGSTVDFDESVAGAGLFAGAGVATAAGVAVGAGVACCGTGDGAAAFELDGMFMVQADATATSDSSTSAYNFDKFLILGFDPPTFFDLRRPANGPS